jgi:hypothetical protein
MNTFFYEDGQENIFNEEEEKVYDPMEDILTHVDDPNIVLETIISQQTYLSVKRPKKIAEEFSVRKQSKPSKLKPSVKLYSNYSNFTRETFIDRMLKNPQERRLVAKVARDLNINYHTVLRWWKYYEWTEEVAYKKFEENSGPKSSFTTEHNEYIKELLDNGSQLY